MDQDEKIERMMSENDEDIPEVFNDEFRYLESNNHSLSHLANTRLII